MILNDTNFLHSKDSWNEVMKGRVPWPSFGVPQTAKLATLFIMCPPILGVIQKGYQWTHTMGNLQFLAVHFEGAIVDGLLLCGDFTGLIILLIHTQRFRL